MAGKKRSGLANDRRAYTYHSKSAVSYTFSYNGNNNTSGNAPTVSSSPYLSGSIITVLGNSGSPVLAKSGYIFAGWNTQEDGSGTSYSQGNAFTITENTILYAQWTLVPPPSAPTNLSSVGGNTEAYILFTQTGTVTNYAYSTDDGATFLEFNPPQIYSPVNITTLSSDGETPLTNETTYTVKLKAVNSAQSSNESVSVDVTPTVTTLLDTNRIIYLDANNADSYSGTGTTWTNLDSEGAYSATLNGSPTFDDTTEPGNKYFDFNTGELTGQYAQINQDVAINPVVNQPFTLQVWVKINNIGTQGTLVSKMFDQSRDFDGYNFIYTSDGALQLHLNGSSRDNRFKSITGVLSSGWTLYTANVQFGNGGGNTNRIFVNGRQVMNITSTETGIASRNQNLTLSGGFGGDGECDIGEFYYYNTQLTTTQIIQNFDATKHRYIG